MFGRDGSKAERRLLGATSRSADEPCREFIAPASGQPDRTDAFDRDGWLSAPPLSGE